ncbi:hypothetical protein PROAA_1860007 [Candidatus Propionivibrio aalborgensis]|uniref:Uncharacterized protein n=1 Tax=Candidatus Propionivibrio aalborgensis TaxID=1860101 RepID=A0A1A8XPK5_9RHOO|nr:hypothetical protein PROAA_1860007 [Candidatus Propionivibrio aalborgensis]
MQTNKVRRAVARHGNLGCYNILASDNPSEDVSLTDDVHERDSGEAQDLGHCGLWRLLRRKAGFVRFAAVGRLDHLIPK